MELFFILGAIVLLVAISYAALRDGSRRRSNDRLTEAATRELYDDPARYQATRQDDFARAAKKE
jgi:hypothetical protein